MFAPLTSLISHANTRYQKMLFYNVRETQELWETRTSPLAWPRTLPEIAYGVEATQPSSCPVFLSCIRFLVPKTIRFSSKLQLMTVSAVTCYRSSKCHGLISAYWQRSGALPMVQIILQLSNSNEDSIAAAPIVCLCKRFDTSTHWKPLSEQDAFLLYLF